MQILGAVSQIEIEDVFAFITIGGFLFGGIVWIVKLFLEISRKFDIISRDREKLKAYWALSLQRLKEELRWHDARIRHLEKFEEKHGFIPRSRPPTNPDGIEFWNNNTDEDETQIPR